MSRRLGEQPFDSRRELCAYLECEWAELKELANHAGAHYKPFDEQQGNKLRHIDSPKRDLKEVQSKIARLLKAGVELPASMLGGVKGGSPKKNAEAHLGQKLVLKLDIRDCFPCMGNRRIFRVFREQLKFSDEISRILTKLTTFQRRLPQGSPTSSILANLALIPLHDAIQAVCKPRGVRCTFFVDDITLSGERVREIIGLVLSLIKQHGFSMRARKVKLLARHREGLNVTGILVNGNRLSVGRKRKEKNRAKILQLSQSKLVSESALRSVSSSVSQVKYISKNQGESLERLARECLPKHGIPTKKQPKNKVRHVCKSTHKHRRKKVIKRPRQVTRPQPPV